MGQSKRLLVAGGLAASVLAGGTLFAAKPASADDWDHPIRRVIRTYLSDGGYRDRIYYYDYNDGRYVPYGRFRRDYDDWYYGHSRQWRRHHAYRHHDNDED